MSKRMRVILADDEFLVREHLKRIVNWDVLGYEIVHEVEDGEEAVAAIKSGVCVPDVIFMDICMPLLDGIEAARRIRELDLTIQIVMLTGHDDFNYARKSLRIGAFDYLSKPINPNEVAGVLEKIRTSIAEKSRRETELITEVLEKANIGDGDASGNHYSETVERIMMIIDRDLEKTELSFAGICDELYMNKSHLSRKFKKEVGLNFNTYLIDRRMKRAMELMRTTSMRNYEIALKIGIDDPNYFSYAFKHHMRISISEFRKTLV